LNIASDIARSVSPLLPGDIAPEESGSNVAEFCFERFDCLGAIYHVRFALN
jgi:hypothetical protein